MKINENNAIFCSCSTPSHVVVVYPDEEFAFEGGDNTVHLHFAMYKPTVWQRIKYLMGWNKYAMWFDVTLTPKHVKDLRWMADFLEKETGNG